MNGLVIRRKAALIGDAFFGPEFARRHQGVLRQFFCDAIIVGDSAMAAMSRVNSTFNTASIALAHLSCLLDYGVPVFTDDVASSNYPVFKGPATL